MNSFLEMEVTEVNALSKKNCKQAQLPFKTMDIKTALKASVSSNRKRKLTNHSGDTNEVKSLKISDSTCIKKTENLDSLKKWEVRLVNCCPLPQRSLPKIPVVNGSNSLCESKLSPIEKPNDAMEVCESTETGVNLEKVKSDESSDAGDDVGSDTLSVILLSSDEADNSAVDNSAANISLNNSVSSADVGSEPEDKLGTKLKSHSVKTETQKHINEIPTLSDATKIEVAPVVNGKTKAMEGKSEPRKRKKMSPEEAKQKAERRTIKQQKKEQQKLEKEKELLAKKEEKRLEKERKRQEIQKKKAEIQKIREEIQKKREEKQRKREEEEKLKLEKKEQEEKEKLRKLQEKEEKNRLKQQVLEAKMEEKRKKEEQRMKALEEKKKAEEEKKRTELEEEKKIEKTKAAFAGFFLKGKSASPPQASLSMKNDQGNFRPFQIKENMSVAPVVPKAAQERFNREHLDHSLCTQQVSPELYLDILKSGKYQAFQFEKVKAIKTEDTDAADVILDCEENEQAAVDVHLKAKLLQFCDNIRPPYWGTWRKKSKNIRPRNPFGRDDIFDYDVDSDDEWDEGGPGESLSGTEDEESEDDYEVDNDFFVPHGYLSPDEEKDEDDAAVNDPELAKVRLKMKEREFESERSKKTTELRPSIIGCFWEMDCESGNPLCAKSLQAFCAVVLVPQPIATTFSMPKSKVDDSSSLKLDRAGLGNESASPKSVGVKRPVPEEAIPYLIQLLHANTNGSQMVVKEFQQFWHLHCLSKDDPFNKGSDASAATTLSLAPSEKCTAESNQIVSKTQPYRISFKQLKMTIREISEWCKCPIASLKKNCWWVHERFREKYGLNDLPVPNKWNYITRKEVENTAPIVQNVPSIKGFLNP